ncbi:hypothetical protein RUM43_002403 [Polyplax serrata]|uniref:Uncharacterized protein n=1 Tax=Polyplax serrata TaxID=468196 RepID=A0AAN8PCN4_POLSC
MSNRVRRTKWSPLKIVQDGEERLTPLERQEVIRRKESQRREQTKYGKSQNYQLDFLKNEEKSSQISLKEGESEKVLFLHVKILVFARTHSTFTKLLFSWLRQGDDTPAKKYSSAELMSLYNLLTN